MPAITEGPFTVKSELILRPNENKFVEGEGWKVQHEHDFNGPRPKLPGEGVPGLRAARYPGTGCRFLLSTGERCSKESAAAAAGGGGGASS